MKKLLITFLLASCATAPTPVTTLAPATDENVKKVNYPFAKGTPIVVSQSPFGKASHSEKGNEYSWDFDVPVGTDVLSIEDGEVIGVFEPGKGGGCNPKYENLAHNIKIKHFDGTVAQYVHIRSLVKKGQKVKAGTVIAKTSMNGHICQPQLHFGIYASENELYDSPRRKTIPLEFIP